MVLVHISLMIREVISVASFERCPFVFFEMSCVYLRMGFFAFSVVTLLESLVFSVLAACRAHCGCFLPSNAVPLTKP